MCGLLHVIQPALLQCALHIPLLRYPVHYVAEFFEACLEVIEALAGLSELGNILATTGKD